MSKSNVLLGGIDVILNDFDLKSSLNCLSLFVTWRGGIMIYMHGPLKLLFRRHRSPNHLKLNRISRIFLCVKYAQTIQGEEEEDIDFTDADLAIDKMLDELHDFSRELSLPDSPQTPVTSSPLKEEADKLDMLRLRSIANVEESEEVDLDALLEDLCAMERGKI